MREFCLAGHSSRESGQMTVESAGLAVLIAESVSGMVPPCEPCRAAFGGSGVSRFIDQTRSTHKSTHNLVGLQGNGRELRAIKNRLKWPVLWGFRSFRYDLRRSSGAPGETRTPTPFENGF